MKYEKEMIEHLSAEINTILNNTISLRTKFSLTLGLGPFIILSSLLIATEGKIAIVQDNNWVIVFCEAVIAISYFVILYLASLLDRHYSRHADNLRQTILKIINEEEIELEDVKSTDKNIPGIYLGFYVSLFLVIISFIFLFIKMVNNEACI